MSTEATTAVIPRGARLKLRLVAAVAAFALGLQLGLAAPDGARAQIGTPDLLERFQSYTIEERELIRDHLERALADLEGPRTEMAVAAAVNTYLHQYLLWARFSGSGAEVLEASQAWCGGHAVAMVDMLYVAGIDARQAVLLGIEWAGNHSMVEVRFSDGSVGLFDPTNGAFFAIDDRPVGLAALVKRPRLSVSALQTDVAQKRTTAAPIDSMNSLSADYRAAGDGVEVRDGRVVMRWRRVFAHNWGWGIAYSGRETMTDVPVPVGQTWGDRAGSKSPPWTELTKERTGSGRALAWAYMLGGSAFRVAHDFRLTGLQAGKRYALELYVAWAQGSPRRLRARIPGGKRITRAIPVLPQPDRASERVRVEFTASGSRESVVVRACGSLLLQAIRLRG